MFSHCVDPEVIEMDVAETSGDHPSEDLLHTEVGQELEREEVAMDVQPDPQGSSTPDFLLIVPIWVV